MTEAVRERARVPAKKRKRALEQWLSRTERDIADMEADLPRLRRKKAELERLLAAVTKEIAATEG